MGLFDLFSNDTAEQAAQQRNQGLQQGYDQLSGLYGQGRDALTTGANTASSLYANLGTQFGNMYGGGASAYGDASGANGAGGLQRATQNFESSPQYGAYGFALDQGLQALNRTHAAAGNLSSGNADADSMKYASGLAGQQYNNYLQGLSPYLGLQGQGALASTAGQAGAATGLGSGLNASYQGQGAAANANQTGQGASDAAATMNNYNVGSNILGAITGVGGLLAGGAGGGLTSGLSSLFGGFGGTPTGTTAPGSMGGIRYPQF
jgi:hypothetical protein